MRSFRHSAGQLAAHRDGLTSLLKVASLELATALILKEDARSVDQVLFVAEPFNQLVGKWAYLGL